MTDWQTAFVTYVWHNHIDVLFVPAPSEYVFTKYSLQLHNVVTGKLQSEIKLNSVSLHIPSHICYLVQTLVCIALPPPPLLKYAFVEIPPSL